MDLFLHRLTGGGDDRVVVTGLAYLPQLLARSTASSELITFLLGGHFERKCVTNRRYTLFGEFKNFEMKELIPNVKKAIENYLEVCDPSSMQALLLTSHLKPEI